MNQLIYIVSKNNTASIFKRITTLIFESIMTSIFECIMTATLAFTLGVLSNLLVREIKDLRLCTKLKNLLKGNETKFAPEDLNKFLGSINPGKKLISALMLFSSAIISILTLKNIIKIDKITDPFYLLCSV